MKNRIAFILIQLMFISTTFYAQNIKKEKIKMNKEIRELVKLGKDSIIQLALPLIDERASLKNFSHTSVQTNGEEIYVAFSNPIMFLPINTIFYDNVGINMSTKTSYKGNVSNPEDFSTANTIPYYVQTDHFKKNIDFILEAMTDIDSMDITNFKGEMRIREKEDHYDINVVSEMQESWYQIKKTTGELYNEGHAHVTPAPDLENDEAPFKEIQFPKTNQ
ncbi:hypothetical protein [Allomuricauda sp. F6463D]|uniref:hypothetical protein n=1 Tax=Allomuricauda sp. F6463D TaxID=2926409 RepID=UPI001FF66987|nr:hypothetical protein [Muricauda sp. F6463D]MCK0159651.1 hypothetical protein [Muricauda sp. F6463D]